MMRLQNLPIELFSNKSTYNTYKGCVHVLLYGLKCNEKLVCSQLPWIQCRTHKHKVRHWGFPLIAVAVYTLWPKYILSHISFPLHLTLHTICVQVSTGLYVTRSTWYKYKWYMIASNWRALDHQKNTRAIFSSGAIMVTLTSSRAQPCGQLTSFCLNANRRQQFFWHMNNNVNPCFPLVSQ